MWAGLVRNRAMRTALALGVGLLVGCQAIVSRPEPRLTGPQVPPAFGEAVPTEKEKVTLPPYVIEPPDILFIEALRVVAKPPYHFQGNDILSIDMELGDEDEEGGPQRDNRYPVSPGGHVNLGLRYGKVYVGGMSEEEATEAIRAKLKETYAEPLVSVQLYSSSSLQPITGEHLVSPDGTVNLGTYGQAYVAGLTVEQAAEAVNELLAKTLDNPKVSLSVFAYNSKIYYVITEGAGLGDLAGRFPITGNETVLDAITQIGGLSRTSSTNVWIARPAPGGVGCDEILPVNWKEIVKGGGTATNYQVMPGDRIFIAENKMILLDTMLTQTIAPFERIFGFTLLSTQTIQTINRFPLGFNGSGTF
jgi:protein involved in polysaccharide export with SLBB domain